MLLDSCNAGKSKPNYRLRKKRIPFFASTFLNGLDPNTSYTLRVTAPDIYTYDPNRLLKKVRELDAIGLFAASKNKTQAVQLSTEVKESVNAFQYVQPTRGRGNFRRYREQGPFEPSPYITDTFQVNPKGEYFPPGREDGDEEE